MELTNKIKDKVIERLFAEQQQRGVSQAEFAKMVAIRHDIKFDKAVLPQIKKVDGRNYNAIKDTSWLILARHYNALGGSGWNTVRTSAYITVQAHLEMCQKFGIWQMLCDRVMRRRNMHGAIRMYSTLTARIIRERVTLYNALPGSSGWKRREALINCGVR